jgi:uncharacterized secreted protein with C-terminal beta-propeller domain
MSHRSSSLLLGGILAAVLPLSGCTADAAPAPGGAPVPAPGGVPALRLVAFDSCQDLLTDLRRAARDAIGPYGFPGVGHGVEAVAVGGARQFRAEDSAAAAPAAAYSGTNTHEQGADEPDLIKTDGRRIVTVTDGVLRVVDAATRRETGRLRLGQSPGEAELLLSGDTALVLMPATGLAAVQRRADVADSADGPELVQVSLAGAPAVVSRFRLDEGTLVDARQTGGIARVVLRTNPRITLPQLPETAGDEQRVKANRAAIEAAPAEAWLPGYRITTGGRTTTGRVGCDRVSRPATYSGTSLVTVLTFDLSAAALGDGDPVAVVADGDTVYGTGTTLYVATDERWRQDVWRDIARPTAPQRTEIHRFDTTGKTRPVYAASGSVPGRLLNQYSLSEFDGHLRVATTTAGPGASGAAGQTAPASSSAIRVLRRDGSSLVQTGIVDGLGKGEQIYAVRFIGPRGYVVTFRQTDPLYSVDLSNPAKPAVTGELKITGYSAHLQPTGDGRLIGVGQEATTEGRTTGTQVSLFDVADPRAPRRLAGHHVADGQSEVEYDPHALLWWPASKLLVVPVTRFGATDGLPESTAVVLRVDDGLTQVGAVSQPAVGRERVQPTIRRSLIVGDTLWTLSDAGLQASDAASLKSTAWLPTA